MGSWKPKQKEGPEAKIQKSIKDKLTLLGWYVKETHGNIYQFGFPDLYCCHQKYGARWVEVKDPTGYSFTPAQLETFPMFTAKGVGVWILTSDNDYEINKLFLPPNWHMYLSVMK